MSDYNGYNGDTEHDMWVDYTYHEYTGELDDWYDDYGDNEPAVSDPGYQHRNRTTTRYRNQPTRPRQKVMAERTKRAERFSSRIGWTTGLCVFAIVTLIFVFLYLIL